MTDAKDPIPEGLLWPLGEALGALPNVKPRVARDTLRDFESVLSDQMAPPRLGGEDRDPDDCRVEAAPGVVVTWEDINAIHRGWNNDRVTPEGAAFLIRLYEADVFDLRAKRLGRSDPVELRAYAASRPALEARGAALREEEARAAAQRVAWLAHSEQIPVSAFSYRLLNDVFFHHGVATMGVASMEIGGVAVSREAMPYASNSGKSRDWSVRFTYTGADGDEVTIEKESHYAENRRNDADRNWGLPE